MLVSDLRSSDSGIYVCKAMSETGETSWGAALVVEGKQERNNVTAAPKIKYNSFHKRKGFLNNNDDDDDDNNG